MGQALFGALLISQQLFGAGAGKNAGPGVRVCGFQSYLCDFRAVTSLRLFLCQVAMMFLRTS